MRAEHGSVMEDKDFYPQQEALVSVGMAGRLTVNRPFFSGVEGCSLRSSVCGSCTFSMPAPSSSFFSRAE